MKNKKISLIIILLLFINSKLLANEKLFIVYNINNEILTNIDIIKESKYLIILNNQLKNLEEEKIINIAKESALREIIKKTELSKYFDLNKKNPTATEYIKTLYQRLKLKNEIEFKKYLKSNGLQLDYIEKKIMIEMYWNQLIYDKYIRQVKINENKLKKEIKGNDSNVNEKSYLLSEIYFEKNNQVTLDQQIKNINESIKEIGFKNTANIYSISDSSKFGGDIGWVDENKLSNKILEKVIKINMGEHTKPIQIGGYFLILKIEKIKSVKKNIDQKEELEKRVKFETSRQLDQFSKIYYNKIKINTNINEL